MDNHVRNKVKSILSSILVLVVIFAGIRFYQWYQYSQEYNSADWYEVTAEYYDYYKHTEMEHVNEKLSNHEMQQKVQQVDYYDWYYQYTALDGKIYTYVDNNKTVEPGDAKYSMVILVDKSDPSHAIKKQVKSSQVFASVKTVAIAGGVGIVIIGIAIIAFWIVKLGNRKKV